MAPMTESEATGVITSLCETWYRSLLLYAARMVRSMAEAQDLTQDVFMDLYAELRSGRVVNNPKGWTVTVLRRKISSQTARTRREGWTFAPPEMLDRLSAPPATDPSWTDDLQKLLSVLTAREQEVLLLRLGGMKYREIAHELGLSGSAVNTLLARALRKLQRAADPKLPGGSCAVQNLAEFDTDTLQ
jgi:RNA polymerase sigma factor (sigma-70 family)